MTDGYLEMRIWLLEFIFSGRSAAWLARLPWEQEVGRSNRLAPTIFLSGISDSCLNIRLNLNIGNFDRK